MSMGTSKKFSLVYAAYIMMNLYYGLTETIFSSDGIAVILLSSIGLIALHIILSNRHNVKNMLLTLVLIVIFGYNYYKTGDSRILALIMMIFGIKDLELENILKIALYEKLIITFVVIAASLVGLGISQAKHWMWGFSHGNQMMLSITTMMMMYLCVYWKKTQKKTFLILLIIIFISYKVTHSRTGLITTVFIWLMAVCHKYFNIKRMLEFMGKYLPFILMFMSIYLPLAITEDIFVFTGRIPGLAEKIREFAMDLNVMLTNRLTLTNITLNNTEIGWLGSVQDMSVLSKYSYRVVDSGYVQMLLVFGFLGSIIFMLLNYLMTKELIRRQQYVYLIAVIAMALYSFTENSWCSLKYNFTLLFLIQLYQPMKEQIGEYARRRRRKIVLLKKK